MAVHRGELVIIIYYLILRLPVKQSLELSRGRC
jgi:hypothetical protein